MEDWVERAMKEADKLDEKISKLEEFIESEQCFELPTADQILLFEQLTAMLTYSALLGKRLERFHDRHQ